MLKQDANETFIIQVAKAKHPMICEGNITSSLVFKSTFQDRLQQYYKGGNKQSQVILQDKE